MSNSSSSFPPFPAALATQVLLQPERAGLAPVETQSLSVLVRLQAPTRPAQRVPRPRQPQALALVIDKSGSMGGDPLQQARRCARMVVERLQPADHVAVVEFGSTVRLLWPAVQRGDGQAAIRAIETIEEGGTTNLHGGWLQGAQALADVAGHGIKRVMLLSDGGANAGETSPEAIAAQCAHQAAWGVTTSTYGLGEGFNEDLMVRMARAGGGNSYYGDKAEDLMEPFQREIDLLDHLCLRDLRLMAQTPEGVSVELLNDLPREGHAWRLPDLAWEAEAWAVLRLSVPVALLPRPGARLAVLRVTLCGTDVDGNPVELERSSLALPVMSQADLMSLAPDTLVQRRVAELLAAKSLLEMRQAASGGNWESVETLLAQAMEQFADNEWVRSVLDSMKEIARRRELQRLRKEAMYSAAAMNCRLSAHDEQEQFSMAVEAQAGPSFLRRKSSQGKGQ